MAWVAGDVIRLWDGNVRPAAYKRFVCVLPAEGGLLRINSAPHWKPHFKLQAANEGGAIEHDCFVELRCMIEYIDSELDEANHLGRLSDATIAALIAHLPTVETFTDEECDLMCAALTAALP